MGAFNFESKMTNHITTRLLFSSRLSRGILRMSGKRAIGQGPFIPRYREGACRSYSFDALDLHRL